MTKKVIMRLILIAGSMLIVLGGSLTWWMLDTEEERNVIELQLESGDTEAIEFEGLRLVPGSECEYTILLARDGAAIYDLGFDFVETEEKTLKNFARVKIVSSDEVLYDELLAAAFEDENIVLPVDFTQDKNTELKIVYYMPIEVGNEAKNAEAIFELRLTASNE